jgi:hypothetical protein
MCMFVCVVPAKLPALVPVGVPDGAGGGGGGGGVAWFFYECVFVIPPLGVYDTVPGKREKKGTNMELEKRSYG